MVKNISIVFSFSSPSIFFYEGEYGAFSTNFLLFAMLETCMLFSLFCHASFWHAIIFLFGGSIFYLLFAFLEGVRQKVLLWEMAWLQYLE